ncbi:ROK family transcriptional regulator [uncultured Tessaracoccus sp.]|uniref:ROK family transcriptional regulator n=1 Tax=uncultured Tessaracoccus sp. TaxID=905023 RepID=UPI00261A7667|nr:ROK family transcriptional regulator [uncultured Tessaracoccus sp.]
MNRAPSRTGSNAVLVGSWNQAVVLDAIRRAKSISRVEIAAMTGLASQTVTNICRRLIDDGIIVEAGRIATPTGKPRTALAAKPDGLFAVGVLVDPDTSSAVLLDIAGNVRERREFELPSGGEPGPSIEAMASVVRELCELPDVDGARLLGVGVGTPGPIDRDAGAVVRPPNLPRWVEVPLADALQDAVGLPVVLAKDVAAASVAEAWYGSGIRRDSTAVIYVGTGIGVGVHVDGETGVGVSGNAGEVGHLIVDPDGARCDCGSQGCVASVVAPSALVARFGCGPRVSVGMAELVRRADDEPQVDRALTAASDGLLHLGRNMALLHDVNRLVFGGPMWCFFEPRLSRGRLRELADELSARAIHKVTCRASRLGEDLGAVGAACLVFDRLLGPRPAKLMLHGQTRLPS